MSIRGTISKIDPIKYSRRGGSYIRIHFRLDGGVWAKTDIVPGFRNYARWEGLMKVGLDLDGLILKRPGEIDADSYPEKFSPPKTTEGEWVIMPDDSRSFVERPIIKSVLPPLDPEPKQNKLL